MTAQILVYPVNLVVINTGTEVSHLTLSGDCTGLYDILKPLFTWNNVW